MRWLGLGSAQGRIGLRPLRNLELAVGADQAYERARSAMNDVLGATIYLEDRAGGMLEAGFGLVNHERVRCTFTRRGDEACSVRIEAIFPAGAQVPIGSRAVEALAEDLASFGYTVDSIRSKPV